MITALNLRQSQLANLQPDSGQWVQEDDGVLNGQSATRSRFLDAAPAPAASASPSGQALSSSTGAATTTTTPATAAPHERTSEEWSRIASTWNTYHEADPYRLMQQMCEFNWDAADIAQATGQTAQQVGAYLTAQGAPAGFGGAVTTGQSLAQPTSSIGRLVAAARPTAGTRLQAYLGYMKMNTLQQAAMRAMVDTPANQELLRVFGGGNTQLPNTEMGERMRALYGTELGTQLARLTVATDAMRKYYKDALDAAMHPPKAAVAYVDESGVAHDESGNVVPLKAPPFDGAAFHNAFISRDTPQSRVIGMIYGQATNTTRTSNQSIYETSGTLDKMRMVIGIDDGMDSIGSPTVATDLSKVGLVRVGLDGTAELFDKGQVYYEPMMGFVTPETNVKPPEPDFFDKFMPMIMVAVVSYFSAGTLGPAAAGAMGLTGTAATVASAAIAGAATSMVSGMISGNLTFKGILQGALSGALTAGLFSGVESLSGTSISSMGAMGSIAARTTVQGAVQALMGGSFKDGAIAGFAAGLGQALSAQLNDNIMKAANARTMTPSEVTQARYFSNMVGESIRIVASGDSHPGYALASAFLTQTLGQLAPQDATPAAGAATSAPAPTEAEPTPAAEPAMAPAPEPEAAAAPEPSPAPAPEAAPAPPAASVFAGTLNPTGLGSGIAADLADGFDLTVPAAPAPEPAPAPLAPAAAPATSVFGGTLNPTGLQSSGTAAELADGFGVEAWGRDLLARAATPQVILTQEGDSWARLAREHYGDERYALALAQANGARNTLLKAGAEVRLPVLSDADLQAGGRLLADDASQRLKATQAAQAAAQAQAQAQSQADWQWQVAATAQTAGSDGGTPSPLAQNLGEAQPISFTKEAVDDPLTLLGSGAGTPSRLREEAGLLSRETVTVPLARMASKVDEAVSSRAAAVAGLFGQTEMAGQIVEGMNAREAALNQWANPQDKAQSGWEYVRKSEEAGVHNALAAGAKLLDTFNPFAVSDAELAEKYKADPAGLQKMREEGLATGLSRFARHQSQAAEQVMQSLSPEAQAAYGHLTYATTNTDQAAYLSPVKMLGDGLQSLPTTAGLAATAFLTRGASLLASAEVLAVDAGAEVAATAAAVQAAGRTAAQVGALTEGSLGYAQQALSTQAEVERMTFDDLQKSPSFQRLLDEGYSPEAARLSLAAQAGKQAGVAAGVVDATTGALGGTVFGRIIGEGGAWLPRTGRAGLTEGLTEALQSGGEQLSHNQVIQTSVDPTQSLTEGVSESMAQGLAVGGLTGGAMAGPAGHFPAHGADRAAPAGGWTLVPEGEGLRPTQPLVDVDGVFMPASEAPRPARLSGPEPVSTPVSDIDAVPLSEVAPFPIEQKHRDAVTAFLDQYDTPPEDWANTHLLTRDGRVIPREATPSSTPSAVPATAMAPDAVPVFYRPDQLATVNGQPEVLAHDTPVYRVQMPDLPLAPHPSPFFDPSAYGLPLNEPWDAMYVATDPVALADLRAQQNYFANGAQMHSAPVGQLVEASGPGTRVFTDEKMNMSVLGTDRGGYVIVRPRFNTQDALDNPRIEHLDPEAAYDYAKSFLNHQSRNGVAPTPGSAGAALTDGLQRIFTDVARYEDGDFGRVLLNPEEVAAQVQDLMRPASSIQMNTQGDAILGSPSPAQTTPSSAPQDIGGDAPTKSPRVQAPYGFQRLQDRPGNQLLRATDPGLPEVFRQITDSIASDFHSTLRSAAEVEAVLQGPKAFDPQAVAWARELIAQPTFEPFQKLASEAHAEVQRNFQVSGFFKDGMSLRELYGRAAQDFAHKVGDLVEDRFYDSATEPVASPDAQRVPFHSINELPHIQIDDTNPAMARALSDLHEILGAEVAFWTAPEEVALVGSKDDPSSAMFVPVGNWNKYLVPGQLRTGMIAGSAFGATQVGITARMVAHTHPAIDIAQAMFPSTNPTLPSKGDKDFLLHPFSLEARTPTYQQDSFIVHDGQFYRFSAEAPASSASRIPTSPELVEQLLESGWSSPVMPPRLGGLDSSLPDVAATPGTQTQTPSPLPSSRSGQVRIEFERIAEGRVVSGGPVDVFAKRGEKAAEVDGRTPVFRVQRADQLFEPQPSALFDPAQYGLPSNEAWDALHVSTRPSTSPMQAGERLFGDGLNAWLSRSGPQTRVFADPQGDGYVLVRPRFDPLRLDYPPIQHLDPAMALDYAQSLLGELNKGITPSSGTPGAALVNDLRKAFSTTSVHETEWPTADLDADPVADLVRAVIAHHAAHPGVEVGASTSVAPESSKLWELTDAQRQRDSAVSLTSTGPRRPSLWMDHAPEATPTSTPEREARIAQTQDHLAALAELEARQAPLLALKHDGMSPEERLALSGQIAHDAIATFQQLGYTVAPITYAGHVALALRDGPGLSGQLIREALSLDVPVTYDPLNLSPAEEGTYNKLLFNPQQPQDSMAVHGVIRLSAGSFKRMALGDVATLRHELGHAKTDQALLRRDPESPYLGNLFFEPQFQVGALQGYRESYPLDEQKTWEGTVQDQLDYMAQSVEDVEAHGFDEALRDPSTQRFLDEVALVGRSIDVHRAFVSTTAQTVTDMLDAFKAGNLVRTEVQHVVVNGRDIPAIQYALVDSAGHMQGNLNYFADDSLADPGWKASLHLNTLDADGQVVPGALRTLYVNLVAADPAQPFTPDAAHSVFTQYAQKIADAAVQAQARSIDYEKRYDALTLRLQALMAPLQLQSEIRALMDRVKAVIQARRMSFPPAISQALAELDHPALRQVLGEPELLASVALTDNAAQVASLRVLIDQVREGRLTEEGFRAALGDLHREARIAQVNADLGALKALQDSQAARREAALAAPRDQQLELSRQLAIESVDTLRQLGYAVGAEPVDYLGHAVLQLTDGRGEVGDRILEAGAKDVVVAYDPLMQGGGALSTDGILLVGPRFLTEAATGDLVILRHELAHADTAQALRQRDPDNPYFGTLFFGPSFDTSEVPADYRGGFVLDEQKTFEGDVNAALHGLEQSVAEVKARGLSEALRDPLTKRFFEQPELAAQELDKLRAFTKVTSQTVGRMLATVEGARIDERPFLSTWALDQEVPGAGFHLRDADGQPLGVLAYLPYGFNHEGTKALLTVLQKDEAGQPAPAATLYLSLVQPDPTQVFKPDAGHTLFKQYARQVINAAEQAQTRLDGYQQRYDALMQQRAELLRPSPVALPGKPLEATRPPRVQIQYDSERLQDGADLTLVRQDVDAIAGQTRTLLQALNAGGFTDHAVPLLELPLWDKVDRMSDSRLQELGQTWRWDRVDQTVRALADGLPAELQPQVQALAQRIQDASHQLAPENRLRALPARNLNFVSANDDNLLFRARPQEELGSGTPRSWQTQRGRIASLEMAALERARALLGDLVLPAQRVRDALIVQPRPQGIAFDSLSEDAQARASKKLQTIDARLRKMLEDLNGETDLPPNWLIGTVPLEGVVRYRPDGTPLQMAMPFEVSTTSFGYFDEPETEEADVPAQIPGLVPVEGNEELITTDDDYFETFLDRYRSRDQEDRVQFRLDKDNSVIAFLADDGTVELRMSQGDGAKQAQLLDAVMRHFGTRARGLEFVGRGQDLDLINERVAEGDSLEKAVASLPLAQFAFQRGWRHINIHVTDQEADKYTYLLVDVHADRQLHTAGISQDAKDEGWVYLYRGDSTRQGEFLSKMAAKKGVEETRQYLSQFDDESIEDLLLQHSRSSSNSPFVSLSPSLELAAAFALGRGQDTLSLKGKDAWISVFKIPESELEAFAVQNSANELDPAPEYLAPVQIDTRYLVDQFRLSDRMSEDDQGVSDLAGPSPLARDGDEDDEN